MIRSMARRLLSGRHEPVLQDRGQEFFPRHLDKIVETPLDRDVLAALFMGAGRITAAGAPPESQLLQDALAVGIVAALGSPEVYLEIGGGPPIDHSNTAALDRLGWAGVVIEPNPDFADLYSAVRSPRTHLRRVAVVGDPGTRTRMSLVVAGELSYVKDAVTPPQDVWEGHRREALRGGNTVDVEVTSATDAWAACVTNVGCPSYVSVDVEGGEVEIISRMPWRESGPVLVTAETSLDVERSAEIDRIMSRLGYVRVLREGAQWDNWYLAEGAADRLASGLEKAGWSR